MPLQDISLNLVSTAQDVLRYIEQNKSNVVLEGKDGKRYRQIEGQLLRIKNGDRHLTVGETQEEIDNLLLSIKSSYYVLSKFGNIVEEFKELCLAIMFVARELEVNKWYDEISKTCTQSTRSYSTDSTDEKSLEYISGIPEDKRIEYVNIGAQLLTFTIIEFFQSDHHTSRNTLESPLMQRILRQLYRDDDHVKFQQLLVSSEVLQAITALAHWGGIKCVLKANGMHGVNIADNEPHVRNMKPFPTSPEWLSSSLFQRYPAGASKFLLTKDCLLVISESPVYGRYLSVPAEFDMQEFFTICDDIESNPLRYHIRASTYNLSVENPLDLNRIYPNLNELLEVCAAIIHASSGEIDQHIIQSTKFPALRKVKGHKMYSETIKLRRQKNKNGQMEKPNSFAKVVGSICG